MEQKPDIIKISASHKEEIFATHADLHVVVKGSSLVSGNEAMKKAKEVNQLLEALKQAGVKEEAVTLQGVNVSTSTGAVLKSSMASYRLKIHVEDLSKFAEILDVISNQKNVSVTQTEWQYKDQDIREHVLLEVMETAKSKAIRVAQSLGVKLLGVYDFTEHYYDYEDIYNSPERGMLSKRSDAIIEPSLSIDIQHSKTIQVNVEIWHRVFEFSV